MNQWKFLTYLVAALLLPVFLWAKSFSVFSYNVENLFDTHHDQGKVDYAYLPLSEKKKNPEVYEYCKTIRVPPWREECYNLDWSELVLKRKIRNISRVIHTMETNKLPDILVLQEVENLSILKRLNEEGNLDYQNVILLEADDSRGIDVAILSNFPLVQEPDLHYIDSNRKIKTRGILEAKFEVYGKHVTVFANHWPSQGNPDQFRELAAKKLMYASSRTRADIRIAAGDFNTLDNDNPHGLNEHVLKPKRSIYFIDTNPEDRGNLSFESFLKASGSHWYRGKWTFLDKILIDSKSVDNGITTEFRLHAPEFALREIDYRGNPHTVPHRFDPEDQVGYADHLPVGIKVNLP